ncbi:hypothetical protein SEA_PAPAYASALAD_52 [Streptomyces phage PapayaSalad]|uniref:Uncharacterized protein n=1 Tax=Streptomyces phage PapayaSalad TaxID=1920310 RepID=A0A1J0MC82_9CAUD|nr:hypothetical protein HOR44_gp29 [Streptomyces phage PapayaSalad]APD18631.1 hypothetical protein SEA_PAPAYASALAD_52 [Streptomyces phage PapayaSalad]
MANRKTSRPRSPNLTVRLDPTLAADLDTITSTGIDRSAAVRLAVAFLAFGYRDLWANGIYPERTAPPRMRWTTPRHYARQAPDLRVVRTTPPRTTPGTTPRTTNRTAS